MRILAAYLCASVLICGSLRAQTAQATLSGEVRDAAKGQPLAGARIFAENQDTGSVTTAVTNAQGQYALQFLPPGSYVLRVQAAGYRPLERRGVDLHVAQQAAADFALQELAVDLKPLPAESLSRGAIGLIYGPDAQAKIGVIDDRPPPMTDATSSTVSSVIDEQRIRQLPLAGRDIYTLFVMLPGVTSDNATSRGLGFSVNGFRVSSSNYLLDGVDNNNVRTTSPGALLSPEAIEEYRLATGNFSAEYGRGAFAANVITRAGGNRWQGGVFEFLFNEHLNANGFQDNAAGRPRPVFREHQFGGFVGGPLRRDRAFLFLAVEGLLSRTDSAPQPVTLPRPDFASQVSGATARALLQRFPARPLEAVRPVDANRISGLAVAGQPIHTLSSTLRADFELRPDRDRLFVRYGSLLQNFEDILFSPYRGLSLALGTGGHNVAVGQIHRFTSAAVNEAKAAFSRVRNDLRPPVEGVPELLSADGTSLPGAADSFFEQSYRDNSGNLVDNLSWLRSRHHFVAGGEAQWHGSPSLLAPGRIGRFVFRDLAAFAADQPLTLSTTVARFSSDAYRAPDYTRDYRQSQFSGFLQDNWRVWPRLTLNLGVRYEYYGVPHNSDPAQDVNYYAGAGASPVERIAAGLLLATPNARGDLRGLLYRKDKNNFAPRFGLAFDLPGNSRLVLRAGYGVYYDRLFNLLWDSLRQNTFVPVTFSQRDGFRYAAPASAALPSGPAVIPRGPAYRVDENLRTPYVQTWFAGLQMAAGRDALLEIHQAGSLGRKLPTRDVLNRGPVDNPAIQELYTLTSQGKSSFLALETSFRRRFHRGLMFQVAHTWSHAIDNQGDALVVSQARERGFQQEFDSNGDRGNSDFDQRHNLILHFLWLTSFPRSHGTGRFLSGWQLAGISGYRTGFPFTVLTAARGFAPGAGPLVLPRADYLGGPLEPALPIHVPGGRALLDRVRFRDPQSQHLGNTGRGEFRGPGFWNHDFSLSREFPVRSLGEKARLQVRADFFNLLNHANLGNPDARLDSLSFGQAFYGRRGFSSVAVGTSPLNEFPRRVQLVLRFLF